MEREMTAMLRFCARTMFVIALLASGTAWGDSSIVGGNVIVNRALIDGFTNFYILDTNHPFDAAGQVTNWEIFAANTNSVQLVIYREEGGQFSEVGRSPIEVPQSGYNLFELDKGSQIDVQAGDCVGIYHPQRGSVVYTQDPPGASNFGFDNFEGTVLLTNLNAASSTAFLSSSNRRYSIRVFKQSP
jgi:hypothetical protein